MKISKLLLLMSTPLLLASCGEKNSTSSGEESESHQGYVDDEPKETKISRLVSLIDNIKEASSGRVISQSEYETHSGEDVNSGVTETIYQIHGFKTKYTTTGVSAQGYEYYSNVDYESATYTSVIVQNGTVIQHGTYNVPQEQWDIYQMELYNPANSNSFIWSLCAVMNPVIKNMDDLYDHNDAYHEYCFKEYDYVNNDVLGTASVHLSSLKFKYDDNEKKYIISYAGRSTIDETTYSIANVTLTIWDLNNVADFELPENPNA